MVVLEMVLMVGGAGCAKCHSHNLWLFGTCGGKRNFVFGLGSGVVKRPVSLVVGHQKSRIFLFPLHILYYMCWLKWSKNISLFNISNRIHVDCFLRNH
jgi:hypothetical protein